MENKKQNNELIDVLNEINLDNQNSKISENKTEVTKEELEQNIYEQETINKKDFCDLDEEIAKLACEIEEESQNPEELKKEVSYKIKLKDYFNFFLKYITSSAAIFAMLLVGTNFSAYSELAMNYINPDSIKTQEKLLYSSVLDVNNHNKNLWEKKENSKTKEEIKKIKEIKEKIRKRNVTTIVKNKTFHSIDKLVAKKSEENLNIPVEIVPFENRIIIPRIGKNIPLIDVKTRNVKTLKKLEEVFNDDLAKGVVRYPGSVKPGETGNVFIFGHSSNFPWVKGKYNQVFALLNNLRKGDNIIVYYNQKKYIYKVKQKSVINPGEVGILKRNKGKKELTLMTCWPVGTTLQRKIIIAELVK